MPCDIMPCDILQSGSLGPGNPHDTFLYIIIIRAINRQLPLRGTEFALAPVIAAYYLYTIRHTFVI